MGTTQGFCYINCGGDECPIKEINLMTVTKSEFDTAEHFLAEASQKLKSIVVCRQVTEQVKIGIKSTQNPGGGSSSGKRRKLTIRLVSSHGLEHFGSSVPLRYRNPEDIEDPLERHTCTLLRSWPFNVCINLCIWISPTNLRKLAESNNLGHLAQWCMSPQVNLQGQRIPVDVKDKGFSLFGHSDFWLSFYQGKNALLSFSAGLLVCYGSFRN